MRQEPRRLLTRMAAIVVAITAVGLLTSIGPAVPHALASSNPTGWSPTNLDTAYGFQSTWEGQLQTVAVVTALDDPDAESDLATYRSEYGLPACTSANGCFRKVGQDGSTTYPATGWSQVDAESLDAISAVCPNCHLLLVEANSTAISDLGAAENEAVALGAKFIDNDWSISESALGSAETSYDSEYFRHPGVAITAPAGDNGYGVSYPAASQYVTAVGGTVLSQNSGVARGWSETAWPDSGAGCSAFEPKPSWQTDTGCTKRTVNDIAAVATNVSYYDTLAEDGWATSASTVVSAAIIAGAYALAGVPASGTYPASYPYQHPGGSYTTPGNAYPYVDGLYNITTGTADGTCSSTYLCTPGAGYNGPTGVGSPATVESLSGTGSLTGALYDWGGECLDDYKAATTTGSLIDGYTCNGSAAQQWTAQPNGTIRVASTTSCLYITAAATNAGALVELDTCSPADEGMQWVPKANGTLYNPRSGLCLYDPASATPGTQLDIENCSTSRVEQWPLPYTVATVTGPIPWQTDPTACMDDYDASTTNGGVIDIYDCNSSKAQSFTVETDGSLQVVGGCVAPSGDSASTGALINYWNCDGDAYEHWIFRTDGTITNIGSQEQVCITNGEGGALDGVQLQDISCGTSNSFDYWSIP